jgi:hypothetical protein
MTNLVLPTRYAYSFKKYVVNGNLARMKSPDYHALFQQILLVCMRHRMIKETRVAIMQICRVFKVIRQKVYNPTTFQHLKINDLLCAFLKNVPSKFLWLDDPLGHTFS